MGTAASSVEFGGGDVEDEKTTLLSIYNNTLSEGQVRLLTLLPGQKNAKIECRIDYHLLSSCPAYTALSYRWDQSTASRVISLNREQFFLRENLWNCFRSIRRRDKAVVLWVDSICINQNNMLERNHQVGIMGKIYSMATDVFIWLGQHADKSEVAMACLKDMETEGLNGKPMILKEDTILQHNHLTYWNAIEALLKRDYWSRVWIIQEILLGRSIQIWCGDDCVSWNALASLITLAKGSLELYDKRYVRSFNRAEVSRILDDLSEGHVAKLWADRNRIWPRFTDKPILSSDVENFMIDYKAAVCTEPLDKIYGFLGLVSIDYPAPALVVDYSKSLREASLDLFDHIHADSSQGWTPTILYRFWSSLLSLENWIPVAELVRFLPRTTFHSVSGHFVGEIRAIASFSVETSEDRVEVTSLSDSHHLKFGLEKQFLANALEDAMGFKYCEMKFCGQYSSSKLRSNGIYRFHQDEFWRARGFRVSEIPYLKRGFRIHWSNKISLNEQSIAERCIEIDPHEILDFDRRTWYWKIWITAQGKGYLCKTVALFGNPSPQPGDQVYEVPSTSYPILFSLREVNGRRQLASVSKGLRFSPPIVALHCLETLLGPTMNSEEQVQIEVDSITIATLMTWATAKSLKNSSLGKHAENFVKIGVQIRHRAGYTASSDR